MDDIICVTNGSVDDHERELRELLNKREKSRYRASEKKTEMFKKELIWLGYYINQNEVESIKNKTEAITKLAAPKIVKELKSFLGSIHYLSKFVNNLSKKTGRMRKLLKKDSKWEWTTEKMTTSKNYLKKKLAKHGVWRISTRRRTTT